MEGGGQDYALVYRHAVCHTASSSPRYTVETVRSSFDELLLNLCLYASFYVISLFAENFDCCVNILVVINRLPNGFGDTLGLRRCAGAFRFMIMRGICNQRMINLSHVYVIL